MTYPEIVLLALALSADAFTVGAVVGIRHRTPRQIFRLSFHFGLFQMLMPLIGAIPGKFLLSRIAAYDHWIAFLLLAGIGGRMIYGAFHQEKANSSKGDLTKGFSLVGLSVATSIDALAAGVTLGATRVPIALAVAVIGVCAALATLTSMLLAVRLSARIGKGGEVGAGLVLIGLGIKTLLEHEGLL